MTAYSHEAGSLFPDQIMEPSNFKDVDDSVKDLVMQYQKFMDSGNKESADALLESNYEVLKPYFCDMVFINKLSEEIYNAALCSLAKRTCIISDSEPIDIPYENDDVIWYQELK